MARASRALKRGTSARASRFWALGGFREVILWPESSSLWCSTRARERFNYYRNLLGSYAEGKTTYRELTLELGHGGLNDFEDWAQYETCPLWARTIATIISGRGKTGLTWALSNKASGGGRRASWAKWSTARWRGSWKSPAEIRSPCVEHPRVRRNPCRSGWQNDVRAGGLDCLYHRSPPHSFDSLLGPQRKSAAMMVVPWIPIR